MGLYPPATVISVYSVFTGVAILLTALRFWVRLSYSPDPYLRRRLYWDDWFVILGLSVLCACTGIQFWNATHGAAGEAVSAATKDAQALVEHKVDFSMIVIEKIAFGAIKLSLLFLYRRIFVFSGNFRLVNNIFMWIVAAWAISFFVADLLLCGAHPEIQLALDQRPALLACGDRGALLIAFAATSIITDLFVLALPMPYIWSLQMRRSKKILATFVFLLGGISTLAGVLRLIFLSISYPMGRLTFGYKSPPQAQIPLVLQVFNPTFWVMVEMCMGAWAANLPVLTPVARGLTKMYKQSSLYKTLSNSSFDLEAKKDSSHYHESSISGSRGSG
ncbi:hypothetical protein QBC37DRAFT_475741 [Rhypophila decipiens]|uniref:Rhodopsin domain-containing protein n=1 Tax=Rhypophila decipiens TaxID=261697 RepID=A0AAN6XYK4_9PEZI|nr:hypothetical protein QBC37DRAFT_475741 [Rhypophila decipiens]